MADQKEAMMVNVTDDPEMWNRCFTVYSLIIIGSKERDGSYNLAPKHMSMPLGSGPYFGFMSMPREITYQNIKREGEFTVSYPRPDQLVLSSLAASRSEDNDSDPVVEQIPTTEAKVVEGKFLEDSYFQLECNLSRMIGKFGEWEIIVGEVIAAYIHEGFLRGKQDEVNDGRKIRKHPLLAYLHPDRFGVVEESNAFPLPKDFKR